MEPLSEDSEKYLPNITNNYLKEKYICYSRIQ